MVVSLRIRIASSLIVCGSIEVKVCVRVEMTVNAARRYFLCSGAMDI